MIFQTFPGGICFLVPWAGYFHLSQARTRSVLCGATIIREPMGALVEQMQITRLKEASCHGWFSETDTFGSCKNAFDPKKPMEKWRISSPKQLVYSLDTATPPTRNTRKFTPSTTLLEIMPKKNDASGLPKPPIRQFQVIQGSSMSLTRMTVIASKMLVRNWPRCWMRMRCVMRYYWFLYLPDLAVGSPPMSFLIEPTKPTARLGAPNKNAGKKSSSKSRFQMVAMVIPLENAHELPLYQVRVVRV